MHVIDPSIQRYAWGGKRYVPELLAIEADGGPYAELWYGCHPSAPSTLIDGEPLSSLAGAADLPYLLKVLSIDQPLSIQVHPTKEQAVRGFRADEEAGIPIDSPLRNFKDSNHKPETIVALSGGLEARAGLRTHQEFEHLLCVLGSRALIELWTSDEVQESHRSMVEILHNIPKDHLDRLIGAVLIASANSEFVEHYPDDSQWLRRCTELYGTDAGVIIQLLMNYVRLSEGEALHMRAGELHAYLYGNGVEVMACSDNVIRAGLTPKHIDIPLLLDITSFAPTSAVVDTNSCGELSQTGIEDYRLRCVTQRTRQHIDIHAGSIALCLEGGMLQNGSVVRPGQAGYFESDQSVLASGAIYIASSNISS